ncbi:MAG: M24B family metallopeptidase, partial [Nitrospirota bacterium]|nr:M24B family metallopeptidase [Nitrospirota bacterium]
EVALQQLGKQEQRVLCDPMKTNTWIFSTLTVNGAHLIHADDPCSLPKACKNDVEIQGAYAAHERDGVAVCRFLAWLARETPSGHVTELQASAYLDDCRQQQTLWEDASFPTISGAGSNGAIVHYHSTPETDRPLELGTLYLVDSGGQYLDGTTDITRTVAIGEPTEEQRDRYTRVLQGHIALATTKFPEGTTGSQLDALARVPLWAMGLDYDHGTGHGVGSFLGVHEGPQRISKSANDVALKPGMIVSNEPGYYKTGAFGIRLENLVVVKREELSQDSTRSFLAFNTLTVVPFDRRLIVAGLLSNQERDWINSYHARVWHCLEGKVDADTRLWLEQATQPLSL